MGELAIEETLILSHIHEYGIRDSARTELGVSRKSVLKLPE